MAGRKPLVAIALAMLALGVPARAQGYLPNPQLRLVALEIYAVNGKEFLRHRYDVTNKAEYPADMFAAAPELPPCGTNTNSARSWIDFYGADGRRLYGFCALASPSDLGSIWFATEVGAARPTSVYIEITDRQTNTKYRSNLAETRL